MQKFPKVFTLMSAILALAFCLASCKSNVDDDPTMYTVTVSSSIEHGTVTADKSSAEAGATVKLTATADSGYELESYSVKDASENELTVTDGTFTMPASNVTVSATFKAKSSGDGTTSGGTEKQAGSISYTTASISKTTADTAFTNELTKTGDGTVTYSSSKETVATVNATTGEVTIKGAGKTTITATVADSETYTYATKTATYTITVTQATTPTTYIGTKAPSEAKAVGDIVFSDGSATPYSEDLTLTDDEKNAAIAVIFYVGTDCSNNSTSRTLGVGLAQNKGGLAWCLNSANAYNVNITTIQESDKDGSDNLSKIGEFLDDKDDTDTADKYPAFYFGKNYKDTATNIAGTDYESGWYLPSIAELQKIYDILSNVNKGLAACGGTTFDTDGVYWSSSQCASDDSDAYRFYDGDWQTGSKSMTNRIVCAVRAFN